MKTSKIYKYTNRITGMSYIGQTCKSLSKRAGKDMIGYKESGYFWRAIQKYGTECWDVEILHDGLTREYADNLEQIEIVKHQTLAPNGYNLTKGGNNGERSVETRQKISRTLKGHTVSKETRQKISNSKKGANVGKDNHNFGKTFPKEVRQKISAAHKGKKGRSPDSETRQKISETLKGHIVSKGTRQKMSKALKGRKHTPETRQKISESHNGKTFSTETRQKMSVAQKGRTFSTEARQKMSESRKRPEHNEAYDLFHSLPSEISIEEKRHILL